MASAPAWIAKAVLAVVTIGFPIAVVLAWFFDLSAHGLVRTASLSAEQQTTATRSRFPTSQIFAAVGVLTVSALLLAFSVWLRPASRESVEFTQLTDFADAAAAPAISRDGSMLAFLKGHDSFASVATDGQVYIKRLPDGEPVQLTSSRGGKATPTFSPDGSQIYFTITGENFLWNTHAVSSSGGPERALLPNASGLAWLDADNVLFSEVRSGIHMGLRRASPSRANARDVYWPKSEVGMVHRSAVSPDKRWVLMVEMDSPAWVQCRLLPLDGSSEPRPVGPPGACTYADWSPDGRWMYFSAAVDGTFHIWRQRFPKGEPQQLTRGPTEEEGVAVAPDGRSLITAAGVRLNAIWLADTTGPRQVTVENYAFSPVASRDGTILFYLARPRNAAGSYNVGNLVAASLTSGARQQLLPEHAMVHFSLSANDSLVAFVSGSDSTTRRGIWIAPLDRSAGPRRVFAGETQRVFFDTAANIYFLENENGRRYLHRLRAPDYAANERVDAQPLMVLFAISADGEWFVAEAPKANGSGMQQIAVSTRGLPSRTLCSFCGWAGGPGRVFAPAVSWTRDGRAMLVSGQSVAGGGIRNTQNTIVVPVRPGAALPPLPATGITSAKDYLDLPGARAVSQENALPGATPDQLFFYEATTIRNLYRLQLPD